MSDTTTEAVCVIPPVQSGSFLQQAPTRRALREAMVARRRSFTGIVEKLVAEGAPLRSSSSLERAPRGFEQHAGELGPFLRMNDPVASWPLSRADWREGLVVERVVELARATRRWLMFQREALALVPDEVARPPRSEGARQERPRALPPGPGRFGVLAPSFQVGGAG